ncbi:hypothetical protein [Legionella sp. WA2022007384]
MGILHISPDEHLKRVMGDPSDAILKQRELSEATYPLLISYLEWLRRLNSIKNKNDVIRQNEQFLSEFIHLCEHNLLFFLTVTGQFDIIRSLFEDKDLLAIEIALLEEIEKEQAQAAAAQLQDFVFVPRKKESSTPQTETHKSFPPPTSEWEKSLYGLTNMELYRYYEDEMKRITHIYHGKQIKQIDTSYEQHLKLMRETLNIINKDENINEETKQKALSLYKKLVVIKEEMDAQCLEITSVDGEAPLEIQVLEKQHQIKEEKFKEAQGALEAFFEEVRHESPQLQKIYEEHQTITMNFQKESQAIQSEWKQAMEELTVHYETARVHALEDVDSSLSLIIEELKKCPVHELNEEQINKLDMSVMQLEKYKEELKTVKDYDSTQILLNKCNQELENIVSIVEPILAEDAKKRFDVNVNLIKTMFILTPKNSSIAPESLNVDSKTSPQMPTNLEFEEQNLDLKSSIPVVEPVSEESLDSLVLNEIHSASIPEEQDLDLKSSTLTVEPMSEEPHDSTVLNEHTSIPFMSTERDVDLKSSSSTVEVMNGASKDSLDEKPHSVPIPDAQNIDTKPNTSVIELASPKKEGSEVIPSEEPRNSVHVQRYRFFMNTIRDGTELIEFDPEKQRNYESMIEELSIVLSELNEEAEPEIAEKIKRIENLIEDVKSIGFDKGSPSHIQKICEACNLGIDYEPLNQVKDNLASMFQLKNSPQSGVGM